MSSVFGELRAWSRLAMPAYIEQGFSANKVLNMLKAAGKGYRRQDFLNDWREFKGLYQNEARISSLKSSTVVPYNYMTELEFTKPRKYRLRGSATFTDLETGEQSVQNVQWYSDTGSSPDGFMTEFLDDYVKKYDVEGKYIDEISLRQVMHNKELGY